MLAIKGKSHGRFATSHTCVFSDISTHAPSRHSPFDSEMNGICEQWYDATVGPPCRPAAALTIGMMATWCSTIVAVLVIVAKGLFGSKAKRA